MATRTRVLVELLPIQSRQVHQLLLERALANGAKTSFAGSRLRVDGEEGLIYLQQNVGSDIRPRWEDVAVVPVPLRDYVPQGT